MLVSVRLLPFFKSNRVGLGAAINRVMPCPRSSALAPPSSGVLAMRMPPCCMPRIASIALPRIASPLASSRLPSAFLCCVFLCRPPTLSQAGRLRGGSPPGALLHRYCTYLPAACAPLAARVLHGALRALPRGRARVRSLFS